MMSIESDFSVEKDKYISGVILGNDAITGFYTSPLGNVSQYNFLPGTFTAINDGVKLISKTEFNEGNKSIKFPNGYFLQQIYKTIIVTNTKEITLNLEFVTVNIQNDKKSFSHKAESQIPPNDKTVVSPLNYRSNCGSYITGITDKLTFGDNKVDNTFVVNCKPPETNPVSITTTSPDMSTNTKLFILMCIIICIYLYTRNKPESNVNQRETNSSNNIQIPAY